MLNSQLMIIGRHGGSKSHFNSQTGGSTSCHSASNHNKQDTKILITASRKNLHKVYTYKIDKKENIPTRVQFQRQCSMRRTICLQH